MKALLLCLILAGCGGGGDPAPGCVPLAHVEVDLVGDSTLAHDDPGHPGPILRALLETRFPGKTSVVVLAVPGAHSDAVLLQKPTGDVVYTNLGLVNDAAASWPIANSVSNMQAFEAMTTGKVVIWATPVAIAPQWSGVSFQSQQEAEAVTAFAASQGQALADVRGYELATPGWQALTIDGLHPGDALYGRITTDVIFPKVRDAVAKLECQG